MRNWLRGALALPMAAMLLAALGVTPLAAQTNEEKRDSKLAEPWLKAANWITDYDKALEESTKSGKAIFAYFTRSYAF